MTVRSRLGRLSPRRLHLLPDVTTAEEQLLTPSEIQRGMRLSIAEGIFGQVWGVVTVGTFVTGLALLLGASNFELGLIAALPVVSQLLQLFAAWWVERRGSRRFIAVVSSLGRVIWIFPPLLLFIPMEPALRLGLAMLAMAVSFGMLAVSTNAWLNWMTDLIPAKLRGRFFGTRNTVLAVVSMITIWAAGGLLDLSGAAGQIDMGYLLLFGAGSVAALISTLLVARQPEPRMQSTARQPTSAFLLAPLRHGRFRLFMLNMVFWSVAINIASPFLAAHALKNLGISFQQLATLDVITAAASILSQPYWGRLADKWGSKRVLAISMIGASPLVLQWAWVTQETFWVLYVNAVLAGIFWPGLGLALNNRLMEQAPAEGRSSYLAAYSALYGIAAFAAALLGGALIDASAGMQLAIGPFMLNNYQLMFVVGALLRLGVALFGRRNL